MHVLAFRHVAHEHLGLMASSLARHGLEARYVDLPDDPGASVSLHGAAGVVFMGGPMSVNGNFGYLAQELRLAEQAVAHGKPVMGLCLGAQLIAKALGARVYRNRVKEIGWLPVQFTGEAARDRLFHGLGPEETVFHWHEETFDLPAGAQLLATSPACRNQAFRARDTVYGMQFHLEASPEIIADWLLEDARCGQDRELTAPIDPHAHAQRQAEVAQAVFDRWCELAIGAQ